MNRTTRAVATFLVLLWATGSAVAADPTVKGKAAEAAKAANGPKPVVIALDAIVPWVAQRGGKLYVPLKGLTVALGGKLRGDAAAGEYFIDAGKTGPLRVSSDAAPFKVVRTRTLLIPKNPGEKLKVVEKGPRKLKLHVGETLVSLRVVLAGDQPVMPLGDLARAMGCRIQRPAKGKPSFVRSPVVPKPFLVPARK